MVKVTTHDNTAAVKKALDAIKDLQVYIGVPEEDSSREDEEITNAELAFLMTNGVRQGTMRRDMKSDVDTHGYHAAYDMYVQSQGSPLWQIPPRPIIEPAIEDDKDVLSDLMGEALKAALNGDKDLALDYLDKAGLEGQAASQDWFTNPKNVWDPNAKSTIDSKGSNRPNIDTGELRKAITYVVKKEG